MEHAALARRWAPEGSEGPAASACVARRPPFRRRAGLLTLAVTGCLAVGAGRAAFVVGPGDARRARPTSRVTSSAGSEASNVAVKEKPGEQKEQGGASIGDWFKDTQEFWQLVNDGWNLEIEDDNATEAMALKKQNDKVEAMQKEQDELVARKSYMRGKTDEALGEELNKMPLLVYEYYKMKFGRVLSNNKVKSGLVSFLTYANIIFIGVVLRSLLPRLFAVTSMDDLFEIAGEIGIPSKSNMINGLNYLREFDFVPKVLVFTLCFIAEKVTLISEILPIQVGLKTISPLIFGGLIPGALVSATCETIGASVNFLAGRQYITKGLKEFEIFGDKPLGRNGWFERLEKAAEKDGFKLVLLLRLARILPLPFDSQWYILGALPVRLEQFFAAHWLGCLKTAFLDASIGLVLLSTAGVEFADGASQNIIYAESAAFTIVAVLVQTFATNLVKDILGLDLPQTPQGGVLTKDAQGRPRFVVGAAPAMQAQTSGGAPTEDAREPVAQAPAVAAASASASSAKKQKMRIPLRKEEAPSNATESA